MSNRNRRTTWYRPRVQIAPYQASVLVQVDASLATILVAELEPRKARSFYDNDADWLDGYEALCRQQRDLLMDVYPALVKEIRALRGIDELDPGYDDPEVDPFTLRMGHIEKVAVLAEGTNALLTDILAKLEEENSPEELGEIVETLSTIAALLA